MPSDLARRQETHFVLWRPAHTNPPPRLVIGRFQPGNLPSALVRSISGAALMGIGGAMAYGCSIGQGLTGLSTLAMPSFIAAAGILTGAAVGIRGAVAIPALAAR